MGLGEGGFSLVNPDKSAMFVTFGKGNLVASLQVYVNNKAELVFRR